jgi:hypothetical protein
MHLTSSELQALNDARYEISALQVLTQLLRMELLLKANFNPKQPRVPRGNADGGQWTRVGADAGADNTPARTGTDTTSVREPPPQSGIETTTLPDNHRIVRDRSGTEPWEAYVETLRPNGSVSERVVVNRDGSAIRSQYSTSPELTGWDESHTVIGAGGELATFQNLDKTQTVLDGKGEVIQVASWTAAGPEPEILRPDLGFERPPFGDGLALSEAAAAGALMIPLFAWLASTAAPTQSPVLAFRAREFRKPADEIAIEPIYVGRLEYEEVERACPGIVDVQGWTNKAAIDAGPIANHASRSIYGTAVHTHLKEIVRSKNNADLKAENSYLKSEEEGYGVPGTIRIDVLDRRPTKAMAGVVCVYDIKTGASRLRKGRSAEIVRNVLNAFPNAERFLVTEITPAP